MKGWCQCVCVCVCVCVWLSVSVAVCVCTRAGAWDVLARVCFDRVLVFVIDYALQTQRQHIKE